MRRRFDELHLLLPLHRPDSRLPARRNPPAHLPALCFGLPVLRPKLMAFRTLR